MRELGLMIGVGVLALLSACSKKHTETWCSTKGDICVTVTYEGDGGTMAIDDTQGNRYWRHW